MILETKEELMKQLTDTWNVLIQVDAKLEDTVDYLSQLRKDIRNMKRDQQHDQGPVRGATGLGAAERVDTRPAAETKYVLRVPART